jgi:hypothetical protein
VNPSGSWTFLLPAGTNTVCVQSALGGVDSLIFPGAPGGSNASFKNSCTETPGQLRVPVSQINNMVTQYRNRAQAGDPAAAALKTQVSAQIGAALEEVQSERQEIDKAFKQSRIVPQPVTTPLPTAANRRPQAEQAGAKVTSDRVKDASARDAVEKQLFQETQRVEAPVNPTPQKKAGTQ